MYQVETLEVTGAEPVTPDMAKEHLEIVSDEWDEWLARTLRAARSLVERRTGVLLRRQTLRITFAHFANPLILPRAPIAEVTAVTYGDDAVSGFRLQTWLDQPQLRPAADSHWPVTREPVVVEARAGYADGQAPETLVQAILMLVGDWFRDRENSDLEVRHAVAVALDALLIDHKLCFV